MAIIKYTLVNGTAPNYITDGGHFLNPSDNTQQGRPNHSCAVSSREPSKNKYN